MIVKSKKFLPGIQDYLENTDNKKTVSSSGLEEIISQVIIKTAVDADIASTIVGMFFNEIRNSMLRGNIVTIKDLGKFFISSPRVSQNKERIFPTFKPYKKIIKKLNDI